MDDRWRYSPSSPCSLLAAVWQSGSQQQQKKQPAAYPLGSFGMPTIQILVGDEDGLLVVYPWKPCLIACINHNHPKQVYLKHTTEDALANHCRKRDGPLGAALRQLKPWSAVWVLNLVASSVTAAGLHLVLFVHQRFFYGPALIHAQLCAHARDMINESYEAAAGGATFLLLGDEGLRQISIEAWTVIVEGAAQRCMSMIDHLCEC